MPSIINVLDDAQRREFDKPPKFSYPQRKIMFSLTQWAETDISLMLSPINKIGLVMQMGYFKGSGRFFKLETFSKEDFGFVVRMLKFTEVKFKALKTGYHKVDAFRHRQLILENFGVSPFDSDQRAKLYGEAVRLLKRQAVPRAIFYSLATFIRSNRVEVPGYFTIAKLLTEAIRKRDATLMGIIDQNISPQLEQTFEKMLSINEDSTEKRYLLTQLQRSREVMRPNAIRANIKDYRSLKTYYQQVAPLLPLLDISDEMIRYYAQFVFRSQIFQVSRRENKYLMLLCFIAYQYRFLGDLLVETFLRATQQFENAAKRVSKETIYQNQLDNQSSLDQLFELNEEMIEDLNRLETMTLDFAKTNEEKIDFWIKWVSSDVFLRFKHSKSTIGRLRKGGYVKKDDAYYQVLEQKSRQLQYRVSDMLRHIDFDCTDENLRTALVNFKRKDGNVGAESFKDSFLKKQEKDILERSGSATSLYKVILTQQVAKHIKSGQISLRESFSHQAFEHYLIDRDSWQNDKEQLIGQFQLEWLADWQALEKQLKERLSNAYQTTFQRINEGQNQFVHKRKDSRPRFTEPTTEDTGTTWELFPKEGSVSIIEVLDTIQQKAGFTNAFQHFAVKDQRVRPENALFFAGILAYGCNIGLGTMSRNAPNIPANSLENMVNSYLSLENVQRANNKVISLLDKLKIGDLFKKDPDISHTSSDGQKVVVQVDSIHSNYSYKYFGKDKGIIIYSFIDELHRLFHSLTVSSAEKEALYVFEGLLQNQVVQSDLHSTDSHGTNGINRGGGPLCLTFFSGYSFYPKNWGFPKPTSPYFSRK